MGTRNRFPRTNNNNQGSSPTKAKDHQIPRKIQVSTNQKKSLQTYIGFLKYYRNSIRRLAEPRTLFFQLLKTTDAKTKIAITPDIMKELREINEALGRCCQLALR